ncbi:hypothetical protein [Actinomadura sp. 9N407]|uniref:DUF7144 family membrane protein n=1 Tax=Actinomadura sp. 9N407 TaxID=3375154 RepID=UPI0037A5CAD6
MTGGTHTQDRGAAPSVNRAAVGLSVFAACVMVMSGMFSAIAGFAAILENEFFVVRGGYVFEFDVTAWGWIHLLFGILVVAAGFAVLSGRAWARSLGIVLAVLNAIANFMFIPYYPVWSLLIIALDIAVIWALAVYSRQAADAVWD